MKKVIICFLIGLLLFCATACIQPEVEDSGNGLTMTPDPNKTDMENLVYDNNTFALDLYRSLKNTPDNVFYSPYSISSALAMTYAGAREDTEKEMAETLHFILPQDRLHSAFHSLSVTLASRGSESDDVLEGFILKNVNALWAQEHYNVQQSFLDTLTANYGAGLRIVNFFGAPEDSRITINDWVSEQTGNRINALIPPGSIDPLQTYLILTDAIYFKAAWYHQFLEQQTAIGNFNLLDGETVSVPMMKQTETFNYTQGNDYQAVELPYQGEKISMVILLPEAGRFDAFENNLDYQNIETIIGNLEYEKVNLSMPKFEFGSDLSLSGILRQMGMPLAFIELADFTGISGEKPLYINRVYHKTFVAVDEKGTEAAAASAVMMAGAAPGEPVTVNIDRPFIFLIRDIDTGAILFIGRVMNPLES